MKCTNIAVAGEKALAVEVGGTLRRVPADVLGSGAEHGIESLLRGRAAKGSAIRRSGLWRWRTSFRP